MTSHIYLRAYLAGMAFPGAMQPVILTAFAWSARSGYAPWSAAALLVFPMAIAPNAWGLWNLLYVAFAQRRAIPIGVFGAILPAALLPLLYVSLPALGHRFLEDLPARTLASAYLLVLIAYYLVWKHIVAFFNRLLEIDQSK